MKLKFQIILLTLLIVAIATYLFATKPNPQTPVIIDLTPDRTSDPQYIETKPTDNSRSPANQQPAQNKPSSPQIQNPKIVVWKSARRLDLYSGDEIVRSYKIGLGFSPVGDKQSQGDGKTPEGEFYICMKNPHSRFYLALGISYPSKDDAEAGLRDGRITEEQYHDIVSAIDGKRRPPWDTPLGGEIFIHGHGSSSDWTLGCIALDDADIRELYNSIPLKTPVIINP